MIGTFAFVLFFTMLKEGYEVYYTISNRIIGYQKILPGQRDQFEVLRSLQ